MNRIVAISVLSIVLSITIAAYDRVAPYHSRYDFLFAPSSMFEEGLIGFVNPANLEYVQAPEFRLRWSTEGNDAWSFENWGVFAAVPHLGFGIVRQHMGGAKALDYRLSLGFGDERNAAGIGYGWSSGDVGDVGRERMFTLGDIYRPCRYASVGLVGNLSTESNWKEGLLEFGLRPLGTPLLTLFADGGITYEQRLADAPWSAGAAIEVIPGVSLVGRYFDTESFTVGLSVNLGTGGFGGQSYYDSDRNVSGYSYAIRSGGMRPSFFPKLMDRSKRMLSMNMKGRVDYNRYRYFDSGRLRLMDILSDIRAAVDDERVSAIAVNLSGMRVLPEHAWEIREEFRRAREAGLKIAVFIDQTDMTTYHLASVADVVALDPVGWVALPGYVHGRTFYKGTLEKLGLGFDEWRFFEYKSALETYSREKMSEAAARQLQDLVDDQYELVRGDVCRSRNLSYEAFDEIVNEQAFLMPEQAIEAGLVDTLARWSDKRDVMKSLAGTLGEIGADDLFANALPRREWGPRPIIAVVYALGACAMDEGIRARWLSGIFKGLKNNDNVKAVVFRVDSPGGEAMAGDVVAEQVRECAKEKPLIVSQGQVAASGGYWLSMYADTIVAAPGTYTGSIGVIGGWIYDKGFGAKLGLTSDHVQRGKHADLMFGVRVPFLGFQIPARNLTDEEYGKMKKIILAFYDDFVARVAAGRGLEADSVRVIAEGHVYSGVRGKQYGLVDELGGLQDAIDIARTMAGLKKEEAAIIEIPDSKGLFKMPGLNPLPFVERVTADPVYQYLRLFCRNPGIPLPMLLPGTYPTLE